MFGIVNGPLSLLVGHTRDLTYIPDWYTPPPADPELEQARGRVTYCTRVTHTLRPWLLDVLSVRRSEFP